MTVPILSPQRLYCPNCDIEDVRRPSFGENGVEITFHSCPGLRGLTAPLLPVGVHAKVEAHEREDYVNNEMVQLDPERGRPVMSVVTTRDDGQDTIVFAPAASILVDN